MTFTKIMHLFDRTEERQIRQLALAAEAKVHRLSGSDARYFDREQELILILTSLNKLLDRLLDRWHEQSTDKGTESTTIVRHHKPKEPPRPESAIECDRVTSAKQNQEETTTPPTPPLPTPELSPTTIGAIDLRDWLLLVNTPTDSAVQTEIEPQILTIIDNKLRQILEQEKIVEIVDTGHFDYTRHQIVETRPTTEPERHETIAQTIKPGYLHHDRVIRPQAVIVYILAPQDSVPVA